MATLESKSQEFDGVENKGFDANSKVIEDLKKRKSVRLAEERRKAAAESRANKLRRVRKEASGVKTFREELAEMEAKRAALREEDEEAVAEREAELRERQAKLLATQARQESQLEVLKLQAMASKGDSEEMQAFYNKMAPWSACPDLSCPLCALCTVAKADPSGIIEALDLGPNPNPTLNPSPNPKPYS